MQPMSKELTIIDEPLEIVEQVNAADFEVYMERLHLGNGTQTPAFATVRKDTGAVLGVVGERYTPMQNAPLFQGVEQAFKASGHRFENHGVTLVDNGRQVRAKYRFPDISVIMKNGDESALQILVQNSFDGSLKVAFDVGFFRFICSNGLKVPMFKGSTFSLMRKHTQSLNLDFTAHALRDAVTSVGEARTVFTEWSRTALSQNNGHKVLNGLVTRKALTARVAEGVREIWDSPTYAADSERSVWSLYNATTQHLTHAVAPKRFNLSERVNHEVSQNLREAVNKGIESLFVDSLPERKSRHN